MRREVEESFISLAGEALDGFLERHPDYATELGDHRFDDRLPDMSSAGLEEERHAVAGWSARLGAIDTDVLSPQHRVDAGILRSRLDLRAFELDELREHTWNPLPANPGRAIYLLLARDFAPLRERLSAVAGRLAAIPDLLAAARSALGPMPDVHVETALGQFAGTEALIRNEIDAALRHAPEREAEIGGVRPAALAALAEHRTWLASRLEEGRRTDSPREPRLGAELFARKLSLTLDTQADADAILARAEADLERVTRELADLAGRITGPARGGDEDAAGDAALIARALGRFADDAPDEASILGLARDAFAAQTAFVRDADLVTLHDDPVEVIEMPEIDRGVSVAYCDEPGALEKARLPTFVAVAPPPASWTSERRTSFYREYNRHMVHDLLIHEAMPGHVVQLQHARRFAGSATDVRLAFRSGSFVEGWAVYAEELMAERGYPGAGDPLALRAQQLKMQLRMIINAILDARVHAYGMTRPEAMALLTGAGHQEDSEAAGKWRRAQLTSAQLSTYYVGYTEVSDLVADLRAAHPAWSDRELHDAVLAHGSPAVRHLRTLVT